MGKLKEIGLFAILVLATGCGADTEVRFCFGDAEFCNRVFDPHGSGPTTTTAGIGDVEEAVDLLYRELKPYPLVDSPGAAVSHFWPSAAAARQTYTGLWLQVLTASVLPQAASGDLPGLLDEARVLVAALALNDLRETRSAQLARGLVKLSEALTVRDPGLAVEAMTLATTITVEASGTTRRPTLDAAGNLKWVALGTRTSADEARTILDAPRSAQWIDPVELAWAVTVLTAAENDS